MTVPTDLCSHAAEHHLMTRCGSCDYPGVAPRRPRLLTRLLTPFFVAGEWWVRYTERIAGKQEARRHR